MKTYIAVYFDEDRLVKGPQIINMPDDLNAIQGFIDTDCVDMPRRYIGDTEYRVIVDDSGLLKDRRPTAYGEEIPLVGSIIFTNFTKDGENFRDLTEDEIENIINHLGQRTDTGEIVAMYVTTRPVHYYGLDRAIWEDAYAKDVELAEKLRVGHELGVISEEELRTEIEKLAGVRE